MLGHHANAGIDDGQIDPVPTVGGPAHPQPDLAVLGKLAGRCSVDQGAGRGTAPRGSTHEDGGRGKALLLRRTGPFRNSASTSRSRAASA
jgi:hypothetical protein